ncbi:MAG: DMT family transporter [Ruminococcaceae bacterium]|nr:DMT family transporter [Oscillospiraceae bacterium]
MMKATLIKGYLFAICSALIYGCMPVMAKEIYGQGVNALTLVLLRNLLALPVLGGLTFFKEKTVSVPVKALPSLGIIALFGGCLTPILLFLSYSYIDSGTATVFHFVYPAVVVLAGMMLSRQRKTGNIISVLMCAAGIGLFYDPGALIDLRGCALALLSGVVYAVYVLLLNRFRYPQITGYRFSFYIALISSIGMLLICIGSNQLALPTSWEGWVSSTFFALAITVGAVYLFQQSTFLIGGAKASILCTLEPIISVVLGAFVFHEPIGFRVGIGSLLVIFASLLIALADIRKR